MSWLPRFETHSWMSCGSDGEVEGRAVRIVWRSFEIEIAFGRHNRRLRDDA